MPHHSANFEFLTYRNVIGAGADATAYVLSIITFHLLNNPDKLEKLREELRSAAALLPNGQGWNLAATRQLPYLVCHHWRHYLVVLADI